VFCGLGKENILGQLGLCALSLFFQRIFDNDYSGNQNDKS
jgi:hypothetical protein